MELMQDANLYTATNYVNSDSFNGVDIENRQGVPGCGKTYNFLKTCEPPSVQSTGHLVLFPCSVTREGCENFRDKIQEMYPKLSAQDLKTNYRTLDSYLLHHKKCNKIFDTIMVDEALMVHAGQILSCAIISKAKRVVMIGDKNQIKFIN